MASWLVRSTPDQVQALAEITVLCSRASVFLTSTTLRIRALCRPLVAVFPAVMLSSPGIRRRPWSATDSIETGRANSPRRIY